MQLDGANSTCSITESSISDPDDTLSNNDSEIQRETSPIQITPKKSTNDHVTSSLPLITVTNARSLYNKSQSFKDLLFELGIEVSIVSETWERENFPLSELFLSLEFLVISLV